MHHAQWRHCSASARGLVAVCPLVSSRQKDADDDAARTAAALRRNTPTVWPVAPTCQLSYFFYFCVCVVCVRGGITSLINSLNNRTPITSDPRLTTCNPSSPITFGLVVRSIVLCTGTHTRRCYDLALAAWLRTVLILIMIADPMVDGRRRPVVLL